MKKSILFVLFAVSLLIVICSTLYLSGFLKSHSQTPKIANTKDEFQLQLASKFQLLKIRMDMVQDLNQRFSYLAELVKERKSREPLNLEETKELADKAGMTIPNERQMIALQGFINNPYVGKEARKLLNLCKDKKNDEFQEEFSKLLGEVEADLKVAESMGIEVYKYNSELSTYAHNFIMLQVWMGIFSGKK